MTSAPTDKRTVSASNLTSLNGDIQTLPYARNIELVKCKPQEFGLENWTRLFKIPDYWMRRIYRDQIWIDTNNRPPAGDSGLEKLTKYQKKILYDWLKYKSPFNNHEPKLKARTALCQNDDLKRELESLSDAQFVDYCDIPYRGFCGDIEQTIDRSKLGLRGDLGTSKKKGVEMISGHKIKSEEEIVKIAIDKMNHLSPEEEKKYQSLLEDNEFMQYLSDHVEKYLKFCGVLKE